MAKLKEIYKGVGKASTATVFTALGIKMCADIGEKLAPYMDQIGLPLQSTLSQTSVGAAVTTAAVASYMFISSQLSDNEGPTARERAENDKTFDTRKLTHYFAPAGAAVGLVGAVATLVDPNAAATLADTVKDVANNFLDHNPLAAMTGAAYLADQARTHFHGKKLEEREEAKLDAVPQKNGPNNTPM